MLFENLIGNEKAKENLRAMIKNKQILHSYLLVGPEGIGKKQFAKEFARAILCTQQEKPCGSCKSCLELKNNNNPDFSIIEAEGKIKIEQIRSMQAKIVEKPIISNRKVYILDNSETMTQEAQNCLLKTLEEPPEYITILLISSNENKILSTIKSRCMKIPFQKIEQEVLEEFLREQENMQNITQNMLKMCDGSITKAFSLQGKEEIYKQVENLVNTLENKDPFAIIEKAEVLYKQKEEIMPLLDYMNLLFLEKAKKESSKRQNYLKSIRIIETVKRNLEANSNYDMSIDKLLLEIGEEIN